MQISLLDIPIYEDKIVPSGLVKADFIEVVNETITALNSLKTIKFESKLLCAAPHMPVYE